MKRALVFSGGGTRGSYEMGAWKALRELGYEFDIVVGASIGALNGAAYVQGDYDMAYELWQTLNIDKVMTGGLNFDYSLEALYSQRDAIGPFVKEYINSKGADIEPFRTLLAENLNEEKFFASAIDFALVTVSFPGLVPHEIRKRDIAPGYLKKWVLASASCFPAFPLCEIDGAYYIDGGYYESLPIETAFRMGAQEVVAVGLAPAMAKGRYAANPLVTCICPEKSLGAFLYFGEEQLEENLQKGYMDTLKALGACFGKSYKLFTKDMQWAQKLAANFSRTITLLETGPLPQNIILPGGMGRPELYRELHRKKERLSVFEYFILAMEKSLAFFDVAKEFDYLIEDTHGLLLQALAGALANADAEKAVHASKVVQALGILRTANWESPPADIPVDIYALLVAVLLYSMEKSEE
ncbi:patatin-like phospholipase family protein [Ruminococcaceae bacterium OttesenSCG-928-N02]|nr:patatin-like phospholipase family protein [Ruminococcaceae bacterium OttesenSCG-928-N02]